MPSELAVRPIAWVGAAIGGTVILVACGVLLLLHLWNTAPDAQRARMPYTVDVPGPTLQPAPQLDLAQYRAEKQRILDGAAWIDEKRGIARIPIADAMAMLAAVQHLSYVEVIRWLGKGGLDAATFQTVVKNSQQDCVGTRRLMEIVTSGHYKPRKSWMPKDINFGLDMAREMEVPMPFVGLAQQMFAIAQATGQDGYEATGIACNIYDVLHGGKAKSN